MDLKRVLSVITCVFCEGSAPRHAAGGAVTLEEEEGEGGGGEGREFRDDYTEA